MAKLNSYAARRAEERQAIIDATADVMQQLLMDTLQISLHRNEHMGYTVIKRISDDWAETFNHFIGSLNPKNPEADVLREHMDRALAEIVKGHMELIPFEERYPEAKKISYEARR